MGAMPFVQIDVELAHRGQGPLLQCVDQQLAWL